MSLWMFPISAGVIGFGYIFLGQVRTARRTGVTHFFGQWPDGFEKETQPWQFHVTLYLYTVVGYFMLILGSILLVVMLVQTAQSIGPAISRAVA
jgi:hypothetical protein